VLVHTRHAQKFNRLLKQTSDNSQLNLLQVLKQMLNYAKENGYKIVSVEQLLKIKAYE